MIDLITKELNLIYGGWGCICTKSGATIFQSKNQLFLEGRAADGIRQVSQVRASECCLPKLNSHPKADSWSLYYLQVKESVN